MDSNDAKTKRGRMLSRPNAELTAVLSAEDILELTSQPPPPDGLMAGNEVGPYLIEQHIGEGGGGIVYAARHKLEGRRVALKILRVEMLPFPTMRARFAREAAAISRIRHPNIVEVYEFGELGPGRPYFAMELLEGMDLRKFLRAHGRCSASEALALLEPICHAVQAAHEAGVIHRDIKANNVLLVERNGERVVKLLDFGIAKLVHGEQVGQGLTEPGTMLGTAHSMAPEQVRCERLDERADVYAIGVLLFQLLTGQYPFQANDQRQIALMQLHTPPPRPSSLVAVSPALDAVVLRCLEKDRDKRFRSASELLMALRAALDESGQSQGETSSAALGAYFEVLANQDELNDDVMEDISNVLDTIEHELTGLGFSFPLRTTSALLAVRLVDNTNGLPQPEDGAAKINALCSQIEQRSHRQPGVRLAVSVTVGDAVCRDSASGGVEVVGGPLLEIETWTERTGMKAS